jgi:AcrR family transcriptional regulator
MTAAPTAGSPRRRRMARAERERQMLAVAEQVFAERGYRAAAMDDIAERVGVSKPMLYEYFGSKDGLMRATIAHNRAALLATTSRAVQAGTDPQDKLRRGLVAYFEFAQEHQQAWSVLRSEAAVLAGAVVGEAAGEVEATRRQQITFMAGTMAGFLPGVPALRLEAYAEMLVGACERLTLWRERHPEITSAQAAQYVLDLAWPALATLAG